MQTAQLLQWVEFNQDIPNILVKKGDKGVIVEILNPTKQQKESGYIIEVFQEGNTLDIVSVAVSFVTPLPEIWGQKVPSQSIKLLN